MIQMVPVMTQEDIVDLSELAGEIWREFFPGLITKEQVEYMLDMFLSPEALKEQIEAGTEAFFIEDEDGNDIGFTVVRPDYEDGRLFLSKIYLKQSERGKGRSTQAMNFLEALTFARGLDKIWLTVNRNNDTAIPVYKHRGFQVIEEKAGDIGEGYVMDDYIMELDLRNPVEAV